MASEKTDDPEFNWWTKSLPTQRASVTGVYTDANLTVAYVSSSVSGDTLYVKMTAADVAQIRLGHVVLLRDASNLAVDVVGKVTARTANGASSYIAVYLLEADDNSTSNDLSDCDTLLIIGNANAEGASMPDAIAGDPSKWYNYTQIWRNPLEMTRTALRTRLRTKEQYKEAKKEALELHSIEMEKSMMFGVPSELIGSNGKPERTTLGLIPAIKGGYTGNGGTAGTVNNWAANTSYAGHSWLQGGEDWLDEQLEAIFRYGSMEKLAFVGSTTLRGIQRLIKNGGNFDYTAQTTDYGLKVVNWHTAYGTVHLMSHPLFNYEATLRGSMVIFEPKDLKFRFIDDTFYKDDPSMKKGGYTNRDGIKEEYLTEGGLEYHHPEGWGFLYGFNEANTAS
jgi:hypothetical protein